MKRIMRRPHSVRARLTFWNSLTFAAVLIVLGVVFRYLAQGYLLSALDRDIASQARRVQEITSLPRFAFKAAESTGSFEMRVETNETVGAVTAAPPVPPKQIHLALVRRLDTIYGDRSGQYQYRTFGLDGKPLPSPEDSLPLKLNLHSGARVVTIRPEAENYKPWDAAGLTEALSGRERYADVDADGGKLRVMSMPLKSDGVVSGGVQVAASLAPVRRDIAGLTRALFFILPPALLIAILAAVFLTDRALRPVKALSAAAARIRPDQLEQRLPVAGADEFDELAATFNGALSRVERAFNEREKMMEQLRRFTGDASHELRTPLTTIKANTGVALSEVTPGLEHIHALRQIDRAANRMTSLVDDLLLLARADAGQLPARRALISLKDVLDDSIDLLPKSEEMAHIDCSGVPWDHQVYADPDSMVRLFRNLLENALRYTPAEGSIRVSSRTESRMAQITIADTGAGIAPEHLAHLGERFYRADTGRNRQHGGAGLGIAICRAIALQHGGDIRFQSTVGKGVTVTVSIHTSTQV